MWCVLALAMLAAVADAEIQRTVRDGGSIVTEQSYYTMNEGSTLVRSWVTLDDTNCPLALVDAGVAIGPDGDDFGAVGSVHPRKPISAFEVRFVLLDIFGNHLTTFSKLRIRDFDANAKVLLSDPRPGVRAGFDWEASLGHVRRLLTVVSFVANVRTQDGTVWRYDDRAIAASLAEIGLGTTALTKGRQAGGSN